jgi:fumarate reductase subunit C
MATETLYPPKSDPRPSLYRPVNRTAERIFFSSMAMLLCAVVFVGFSPTYFRAGMLRAPLPSPILHVHGAVFTLWMVLYLVQTTLISARRVAWHRSLGTIAFCLPPVMIILGVIAAIDALGREVSIGKLDPAVSSAIPLIGIVGFSIVIFASWRARRRPDSHKRLILLATMGLTEAAFGRFPWKQLGLPPAAGAVTGLGILILLLIAYDLVSLHRIHRSTLWAAPLTFAFGALAVPIGMTPAWHSFAGFLARNVAPHL